MKNDEYELIYNIYILLHLNHFKYLNNLNNEYYDNNNLNIN